MNIAVKIIKNHPLFFIVLLLMTFSPLFIPESYLDAVRLEMSSENKLYGLVVLFSVGVFTTVVAPLSSAALLPVASAIFGWQMTALISVSSWTVGSVIAFLLARYLGRPILKTLKIEKSVEGYEKILPENLSFWGLVLLRVVVSVDILSYAVGFFTTMRIYTYVLATILGVAPFAVIFSYASDAVVQEQYVSFIGTIAGGFFIFLIAYFFYKRGKN